MMKKAQSMSLNVIIIAVIALIVLVVLVLVFTGKIKMFSSKTTETTSEYTSNWCEIPGTNNECMSSKEECDEAGGAWRPSPDAGSKDCGYKGCCMM